MGKKRRKGNGRLILLAVLSLSVLLPLVFVANGSLFGKTEILEHLGPVLSRGEGYATWRLLPKFPTVRPYVELLMDTPSFFVMFWNTTKITIVVLLGQLFVSAPAAWWLARRESKVLFELYVVLMVMPFQVTMVSNYLVLGKAGLLDHHGGIILPLIFSTFPVFIVYRFFRGIPEGIIEAAEVDGASPLQAFFFIGVPMAKGGIIAAMVLSFIECWSLVEQPMIFLKTQRLWILSQFLPTISNEKIGLALAASVLSILPAMLVFLFGQNYLEQGISHSSLKE